jgi:leucyl-tRNA synthetase
MAKYDHKEIEAKWQAYWEEQGVFNADTSGDKPKFYCLDMFAYPSGEGLHVGHPRGYTASDVYAKYQKLKGMNVLHPFGWDAFGLPTENYALKAGLTPREATDKNVINFKRQLKSFGFGYDWGREIDTSQPEFYKWTQWLFKLLFDNGYAYQKEGYVNWCPKDQTVLANEQVVAGCCERCGTQIEQKRLNQWFFKITDFAEELLDGLDKIDWPQSTKEGQRNWIGKSVGAEIDFESTQGNIKVFTTRPDTLFGVTFLVVSPELVRTWIEQGWVPDKKVTGYIDKSLAKLERDRLEGAGEKTGVDSGVVATHPLSGESIPVWVADYVVGSYGTGAIMAVPGHDARDWDFADSYHLPRKGVLKPETKQVAPWLERPKFFAAGGTTYDEAVQRSRSNEEEAYEKILLGERCYTGFGTLINSGKWDGWEFDRVMAEIAKGKYSWAQAKTQYRLRDWSVARQRYWGAPIPIVYKQVSGEAGKYEAVSVDEQDLPVLLPTDVDIKPKGLAPLSTSKSFNDGVEAKYGVGAHREVETLDTFVCSSWYYLRYCNPDNDKEFASAKSLKTWMPVDLYVGGAEHTNGHLLYARFITKVLHRLGYLDFDEPFLKLRHQGFILGENGEKMSKSRGNVINPDEVVTEYGADVLRIFELFVGPFDQSTPWDTKGVVGVRRFLEKLDRLVARDVQASGELNLPNLHRLVKKVTEDLEAFRFNTLVSSMMEYLNNLGENEGGAWVDVVVRLIAPVAPHMAEELWQNVLKKEGSVFEAEWPKFDPAKIVMAEITIAVQEKGKLRGTVVVPAGSDEATVMAAIEGDVKLKVLADNYSKRIFVADKIINFI